MIERRSKRSEASVHGLPGILVVVVGGTAMLLVHITRRKKAEQGLQYVVV
jgi:hypothetical protein